MYYRVAIQACPTSALRWRSTPLSSLNILMQWLLYFRALPRDRLRVFSAPSRDELEEQLRRESEGQASTSVPATRFVPDQRITAGTGSGRGVGQSSDEGAEARRTLDEPPIHSMETDPLERRRETLEHEAGGDHDLPYRFTLPISTPEVIAWVKLLARARHGDLRAEVAAVVGTDPSTSQPKWMIVTPVS